jgi:hypothetical protein
MLIPELREQKNEEARRRYAERKERLQARFGKIRPSAKEMDKQRNLQLRLTKIFSGEYVAEKETQDHRERRKGHNAYMRAYRAKPEIRERYRQYYIARNKTPKRKLQRHKSYLKYRDRNIAIARDYRKRPDIKERLREYDKLRNLSPERKLQRRIRREENRDHLNAQKREYRSQQEVKERLREYHKLRNQSPERKLQKLEYSRRHRLKPGVREKENEAERRRYWLRKNG